MPATRHLRPGRRPLAATIVLFASLAALAATLLGPLSTPGVSAAHALAWALAFAGSLLGTVGALLALYGAPTARWLTLLGALLLLVVPLVPGSDLSVMRLSLLAIGLTLLAAAPSLPSTRPSLRR